MAGVLAPFVLSGFTLRSNFDVSRHCEGDVSRLPIDRDSHPQVFVALAVHLDLIEQGERVQEVFEVRRVGPQDGEVVHDQSKAHSPARVAEERGGVGKLVVSVGGEVLEEPLLAESS